jgi:predicted MFS family arabinose efflux permease
VTTLAICRALSGLAGGACIPLAIAMIGDRFPLENRQVALSRYLVAVIIGQISGAPLAGLLSDSIGWRPVFGISAAVALIAGIAVRLLVQPRPEAERPAFNMAVVKTNYAKVLANPLARYCYGAVAAEGMFIYGFLPYVAALLEARGAGSVREAGFVVAGIGLGGLLFSLAVSGLLKRLTRSAVMRAGGVVISVGLIGVGIGPSWPLEMLAFTVVGLGFYMLHTGIQTEATELAPDARGSAIALHAFSLFMGMALGPVVYGLMIPALGAAVSVSLGGLVVLVAAWLIAGKVGR